MTIKEQIVEFYGRAEQKVILDRAIKACRKCEGLNIPGETESAPGYGNIMASIMFIGQSLCTQCMATQIPFTRGSGDILDEAFLLEGKMKSDFFITNVVHCHPPKNRASKPIEKINCGYYLMREILLVRPRVIVALGNDAKEYIKYWGGKFSSEQFKPLTSSLFKDFEAGPIKIKCAWMYHPAYFLYKPNEEAKQEYITNLRRLIKNVN